ncbi:NUDIX domain-containing protein [Sphingomonas sp. PL-96]|uniref:NUDIX hydrolase n=1 Tax=Sphingomonas sp. PL-96 TaxID=2887201 RepID=UPI001E28DFAF|nr:NUDIX domain-containing protein [Sphingomonas sp. PL-96]MCC2975224.1 NUDIX domain-containing protein [Sphingomonas sp. PL-96]
MSDPTELIPAATLIVMRDGSAAPELLIVQRAAKMAFAGGALVFPGGRIDPGDVALAEGDAVLAARIAAIRETIEEVGVAVGLEPMPDAAALAIMRARLHAGEPLGSVLGTHRITPERLIPFARWRPERLVARLFDTHFFLAAAPPGIPEPMEDGTETQRSFWASAAQVLADADAGRAQLIFPTRRMLERLAILPSFATAVAHATAYPVRSITPWVERRDGTDQLCIPDDLGYPVTAEPLDRVLRQ